ncbi:MAG: EcsC family protein [Leeuwenhoekiella sp.]
MSTALVANHGIPEEDIALIKRSKHHLDDVTYSMKVLGTLGTPIDTGLLMLPEKYQGQIHLAIQKALRLALKANLHTLQKGKIKKAPSNLIYKMVTGASGATGGFFGVAGFSVDLLLSTKFMMRSIMDIARSQGEDIFDEKVQLACLQVFALGGNSKEDDALDTAYYATRSALQTAMNQASTFVGKHGTEKVLEAIASQTATPIAKLIGKVAARYSIQVSEKFALQAIPVVGAAAGASLNLLFTTHFQKIATAHFTIRRLEREYGQKRIREIYERV